jgi:hypothetical protein
MVLVILKSSRFSQLAPLVRYFEAQGSKSTRLREFVKFWWNSPLAAILFSQ